MTTLLLDNSRGGRSHRIHIGQLPVEHAGEALTVQRAAYVTEAQRYSKAHISPLQETLDEVRAELRAMHVLTFGAWVGPRLVGCVRGRTDGERMEVARLVVTPDMQGRGIGRALLGTVEAAAPAEVSTLWLITGAGSEDSLRLYTGVGYQIVAQTMDSAGVPLVVLEKAVDWPKAHQVRSW